MSTEIKSHKGYPRSSTPTLLGLPKHRGDYRTNADNEYDPCKGPDHDADKFPTVQCQRQVSRRRDLHRVSTSSLTGRSLEDKRNVPATIERILVRKSFSRVQRSRKSRDPPGTKGPIRRGEGIGSGRAGGGRGPRARPTGDITRARGPGEGGSPRPSLLFVSR